jgi:hypothetical protein
LEGIELAYTHIPVPEIDFPTAVRLRAIIPEALVPSGSRFMHLTFEMSQEASDYVKSIGAESFGTFVTDCIRIVPFFQINTSHFLDAKA